MSVTVSRNTYEHKLIKEKISTPLQSATWMRIPLMHTNDNVVYHYLTTHASRLLAIYLTSCSIVYKSHLSIIFKNPESYGQHSDELRPPLRRRRLVPVNTFQVRAVGALTVITIGNKCESSVILKHLLSNMLFTKIVFTIIFYATNGKLIMKNAYQVLES